MLCSTCFPFFPQHLPIPPLSLSCIRRPPRTNISLLTFFPPIKCNCLEKQELPSYTTWCLQLVTSTSFTPSQDDNINEHLHEDHATSSSIWPSENQNASNSQILRSGPPLPSNTSIQYLHLDPSVLFLLSKLAGIKPQFTIKTRIVKILFVKTV